MLALASAPLDASSLARLGILQGADALSPARGGLGLGWPELERALPDRGLPRGVVEIAAMPRVALPRGRCPDAMRGGATSIAIAAVSAAHADDPRAWCAWLTPSEGPDGVALPLLHAPALARAGIDLERLLVVRPPPRALARTVVRVASSGAFALVVVDLPHRLDLRGGGRGSRARDASGAPARTTDETLVIRRLALAAEERGTASLLLTSALTPRPAPWPVAMRIEVERRPDALSIRVTKDRRGSGPSRHVVRLPQDPSDAPFAHPAHAA